MTTKYLSELANEGFPQSDTVPVNWAWARNIARSLRKQGMKANARRGVVTIVDEPDLRGKRGGKP